MPTPRIRMFAGPNGSGKSTLKDVIPEHLIGIYINADEIEKEIRQTSRLSLQRFELQPEGATLKEAICSNERLKNLEITLSKSTEALCFSENSQADYLASVVAEEIREALLAQKVSFTFETVMSHQSKPEILEKAQAAGYRTYLYYIATKDPEINVSRVAYRVSQNGHDVPADKVISRYERSLNLLLRAVRASNRAYLFDNSGELTDRSWFAEVTNGTHLELKVDEIPLWFKKFVLDKA